jgi:hypothetical protein
LLFYNDIEYIRYNDIDIELTDKRIVKIPPLDVFLEVKILQLSQDLNPEKDLFDKDPTKAKKLYDMIYIAIGEQLTKPEDVLIVYKAIFIYVILPIIEFLSNEKYTEYSGVNNHKDLLMNSNLEDKKSVLENYPFLALISNVMMHITIPDSYCKYLGLKYFLWANRFIQIQKNYEIMNNVNLLHETAYLAGYIGNPYIEKKNNNKYKPFDNIMNSAFKDLGIEKNKINKNNNESIFLTIQSIEEKGEAMSNLDYYEKFVKNKKNN